MSALIYLTGFAVFALIILLTLEILPAAPTGRLEEILTPVDGVALHGWRRTYACQPIIHGGYQLGIFDTAGKLNWNGFDIA